MIEIKIEKFSGPLSLLLGLIEKEEMDITQVSLAKIADQYIDYIKQVKEIDIEEMADFLVIASKLLYLKSKALLPYVFPEEEEMEEDLLALEKQLKMYQQFLKLMEKLEAKLEEKQFMVERPFDRQAFLAQAGGFFPPKNLKIADLNTVFQEIFEKALKQTKDKLPQEKISNQINIDEKIIRIRSLLAKKIKFSFNKIMSEAKNKKEKIVSFLALLELIKQNELLVEQENLFSPIIIQSKDKK